MNNLDLKRMSLMVVLAVFTLGSVILITNYAVRYFTQAEEPTSTATGAGTTYSFPTIPTAPKKANLSFEECRRASGTNDPKYDLNSDGIVNPLDCAQLR
jgi:hypothetical protein